MPWPDCIDHGRQGNRDDYARQGRVRMHRLALERKLGRKLVAGEVVRHMCDNKRCVNPDHLLVGTVLDNVRDAFERGLMPIGSEHSNAKLTEEDVRCIRATYIPRSHNYGTRELARIYKVSQWTISNIVRRNTWRHVL